MSEKHIRALSFLLSKKNLLPFSSRVSTVAFEKTGEAVARTDVRVIVKLSRKSCIPDLIVPCHKLGSDYQLIVCLKTVDKFTKSNSYNRHVVIPNEC